ncbi:hypothetical protein RFI_25946 [Reticulomyxa filosa]|uniref:Uncharacterized protein n=1 Tax=Reticulomyxa filosa TaxID=46433 RepID=X6MEH2_RETFI|nr:hypothetical protein RFI_25946 [Reticulomyxa filosa]|eukprot:ETO11430.1 hypothetical protein RFI_25946 [Reticulomyxa filosa]
MTNYTCNTYLIYQKYFFFKKAKAHQAIILHIKLAHLVLKFDVVYFKRRNKKNILTRGLQIFKKCLPLHCIKKKPVYQKHTKGNISSCCSKKSILNFSKCFESLSLFWLFLQHYSKKKKRKEVLINDETVLEIIMAACVHIGDSIVELRVFFKKKQKQRFFYVFQYNS